MLSHPCGSLPLTFCESRHAANEGATLLRASQKLADIVDEEISRSCDSLWQSVETSKSISEARPCRWKLLPEVFLGVLHAENMHSIFLYCWRPNILGNFWLFLGQDQLGGIASHIPIIQVPEYFRCECWLHYIFSKFRSLWIYHVHSAPVDLSLDLI